MPTRESSDRSKYLYRIKVDGPLGPQWTQLLDARRLRSGGRTSDVLVAVADQAELIGRLERIHGLNLKIVSVRQLTERELDA